MTLKSFSETISFDGISYDEVIPGGKGMPVNERAKNLDSEPETGKEMGDGSEVKEFWDEVRRVGEKLGVPEERVVMAVSGFGKGLESSGSQEDDEIVKEFDDKVIGLSQSVMGSLLRRGYGGYQEKGTPQKNQLKSFSETISTPIDSYAFGKKGRQIREIRAAFNVDEPEAKRLYNVAKNQPEALTKKQLDVLAKIMGKKSKPAKYAVVRADRVKQVKKLHDRAFSPEDILTLMLGEKNKWTKKEVRTYLVELGVPEKDIPFNGEGKS